MLSLPHSVSQSVSMRDNYTNLQGVFSKLLTKGYIYKITIGKSIHARNTYHLDGRKKFGKSLQNISKVLSILVYQKLLANLNFFSINKEGEVAKQLGELLKK
jgi:hypothetical protein